VPAAVERIVFPVTIDRAEEKGQHFGQVNNAFIRVINRADDSEMARYDLAEDALGETAMVFGELYRSGDDWGFRAVGQGYADGLRGVCLDFGVNVE
jgi:tellurium resistance protein TerD